MGGDTPGSESPREEDAAAAEDLLVLDYETEEVVEQEEEEERQLEEEDTEGLLDEDDSDSQQAGDEEEKEVLDHLFLGEEQAGGPSPSVSTREQQDRPRPEPARPRTDTAGLGEVMDLMDQVVLETRPGSPAYEAEDSPSTSLIKEAGHPVSQAMVALARSRPA